MARLHRLERRLWPKEALEMENGQLEKLLGMFDDLPKALGLLAIERERVFRRSTAISLLWTADMRPRLDSHASLGHAATSPSLAGAGP